MKINIKKRVASVGHQCRKLYWKPKRNVDTILKEGSPTTNLLLSGFVYWLFIYYSGGGTNAMKREVDTGNGKPIR